MTNYDPIDIFEVEKLLIDKFRSEKALINFNGHFSVASDAPVAYGTTQFAEEDKRMDGVDWKITRSNRYFAEYMTIRNSEIRGELTPTVLEAWKHGKRTAWINTGHETCYECAEQVNSYYNGVEFSIELTNPRAGNVTSCRFPGGLREYIVEIDVPSGKLYFANDFSNLIPKEFDTKSINYTAGIYETVVETAKQGLFTVFVGNSCPAIFQKADVITIGNQGHNDDDEVVDPIDGIERGSICTDLWWVYAVDSATYDAHVGYKPDVEVALDVTPGRYQITIHPRQNDYYGEIKEVFAVMERV